MNVKNYDQVVTALAQILLAANSEGNKEAYGYAPWARREDSNQYPFRDETRLYGEIHEALTTVAGEEFVTHICETLEIDLTLANRRNK